VRIVLFLVLLGSCLARADTLPPVDESAQDPTFLAFKVRLLGTLQRRDVPALMRVLDPKVRVRFGAAEGVAAFRRYWNLEQPAQSRLWTELATVLRLGATRDDSDFIAPYVFTRFPHTLDVHAHAAVIRPDAVLRTSPVPAAAKVATLHFDIIQLTGEHRNGWAEARTDDGKTGWLRQSDLRSPMDYRAFFEKKNGEWKLTAFTTGE
jgi:hypothetical protein